MDASPTRYVRNGSTHIAYRVLGNGPLDLVISPGFVSHVELIGEFPESRAWLERLASFARVVYYDKPGTGASDPVDHPPTLEERTADLEVVLDAAGIGTTALLGYSEGGPTAIMYAARHPERVSALVLWGAFAAGAGAIFGVPRDPCADALYPPLPPEVAVTAPEVAEPLQRWRAATNEIADRWGEGLSLDLFLPSWRDLPDARELIAAFERMSASPGMARALLAALWDIDVRPLLPTVDVPTLVLHARGDAVVPEPMGRALADGIAGARYVTFDGDDHPPWINPPQALDEVEEFLTGRRASRASTRCLATVLFTDLVDSTSLAAEAGDAAWRDTLERHDRIVRERIEANGGRTVKNLGDGHLAEFPGPAAAVRAAQEARVRLGSLGLELRAGVHTGECERIGDDLAGIAVHIGARIQALARPGEIWVSPTVPGLVVGAGLSFEDRGRHELKGVPGEWTLFAVAS